MTKKEKKRWEKLLREKIQKFRLLDDEFMSKVFEDESQALRLASRVFVSQKLAARYGIILIKLQWIAVTCILRQVAYNICERSIPRRQRYRETDARFFLCQPR